MINKRLFLAGLTTGLLSLSVAFPAMAGSWKNGAGDNATRWWYDNGDNTWAANGWRWIDGPAFGGCVWLLLLYCVAAFQYW